MEICCQEQIKNIKIKFTDKEVYKDFNNLKGIGDWIDLRNVDTVTLKENQFKMISLGVAMELPEGYEALLLPRSSTFLKYGIIVTTGMSVIDNSFNGNEDIISLPVLATRNLTIPKGTRIAQFRILKSQPEINFIEVDKLNNKSRGGFGSTGTK